MTLNLTLSFGFKQTRNISEHIPHTMWCVFQKHAKTTTSSSPLTGIPLYRWSATDHLGMEIWDIVWPLFAHLGHTKGTPKKIVGSSISGSLYFYKTGYWLHYLYKRRCSFRFLTRSPISLRLINKDSWPRCCVSASRCCFRCCLRGTTTSCNMLKTA